MKCPVDNDNVMHISPLFYIIYDRFQGILHICNTPGRPFFTPKPSAIPELNSLDTQAYSKANIKIRTKLALTG